jgi:hypothetical protein
MGMQMRPGRHGSLRRADTALARAGAVQTEQGEPRALPAPQ